MEVDENADGAESISVVLPFHAGVPANLLRRALASIYAQTRVPDEVVVVVDGPVTPGHETVIATYSAAVPPLVIVRLPENQGAGAANRAGLNAARGAWIAKADSDDVSRPDRLQRQLSAARAHGYDVVGAAMAEFDEDPDLITGIRRCPETHEDIARRMRFNTPLNHPTVFYRRRSAMEAGGYTTARHMEDWDLFARMLRNGARMHNLQEPLVLFRSGDDMLARRTSRAMLRDTVRMQRRLRSYGLIGPLRMAWNLIARFLFSALPVGVQRALYRKQFLEQVRP